MGTTGSFSAICTALGIDMHEHYSVHGIDKAGIKAKMRALKAQRDDALEAHRQDELKSLRRQIRRLNHQIRAHMS